MKPSNQNNDLYSTFIPSSNNITTNNTLNTTVFSNSVLDSGLNSNLNSNSVPWTFIDNQDMRDKDSKEEENNFREVNNKINKKKYNNAQPHNTYSQLSQQQIFQIVKSDKTEKNNLSELQDKISNLKHNIIENLSEIKETIFNYKLFKITQNLNKSGSNEDNDNIDFLNKIKKYSKPKVEDNDTDAFFGLFDENHMPDNVKEENDKKLKGLDKENNTSLFTISELKEVGKMISSIKDLNSISAFLTPVSKLYGNGGGFDLNGVGNSNNLSFNLNNYDNKLLLDTTESHPDSSNIFKKKSYLMFRHDFKIKCLELLKHNDYRIVSRLCKVPLKSLKRWKLVGPYRKKGGGRKVKDPEMEKKLIDWYHENKDIIVMSPPTLKNKALELNTCESFRASKGWLDKIRKKYDLNIIKRSKPRMINSQNINNKNMSNNNNMSRSNINDINDINDDTN